MSPVAVALRLGIRAYQLTIRPVIGDNCRFLPSCSEYAAEALALHGAGRGAVLAAARICRCHPWHPGGFDPVPSSHTTTLA
jgi:putative membrane protein insertion efficiency factor